MLQPTDRDNTCWLQIRDRYILRMPERIFCIKNGILYHKIFHILERILAFEIKMIYHDIPGIKEYVFRYYAAVIYSGIIGLPAEFHIFYSANADNCIPAFAQSLYSGDVGVFNYAVIYNDIPCLLENGFAVGRSCKCTAFNMCVPDILQGSFTVICHVFYHIHIIFSCCYFFSRGYFFVGGA